MTAQLVSLFPSLLYQRVLLPLALVGDGPEYLDSRSKSFRFFCSPRPSDEAMLLGRGASESPVAPLSILLKGASCKFDDQDAPFSHGHGARGTCNVARGSSSSVGRRFAS